MTPKMTAVVLFLAGAACLTAWFGVAYVAIHFIQKYW